MTQYLPPNLLALFAAREAIPYMPPVEKLPHERKSRGYIGLGKFMSDFEDPKDTPPPKKVETRQERIERRRREKAEQVAYKLEREIALWDPQEIKNATEDPFRTLYVARVNYDTSESKLRREFEMYGTIKKIVTITDQETGKPKGYAFIEYEHERDMHAAYKHADGKKIDGKRVLVDVERARTVKGWLPRRLGGGLGGTRRGGNDVNIKHSGREDNERERERYRLEREREDREGVARPGAFERNNSVSNAARRRSRSRERVRERERERERERPRRSRSRSRERRKRRADSREREYDDFDKRDRRDRERERGRDKKARRRSKSRDRDVSRERRDKKRDRRDKERGSERDRDTKNRSSMEKMFRDSKSDFRDVVDSIKIKDEPMDDGYTYQMNAYNSANIKREDGGSDDEDEQKFRPPTNMFSVPPPPPVVSQRGSDNGQDADAQQQWWR